MWYINNRLRVHCWLENVCFLERFRGIIGYSRKDSEILTKYKYNFTDADLKQLFKCKSLLEVFFISV